MTLTLPSEALPYVLLQRTQYALWGNHRFLAKLMTSLPSALFYALVRGESRLRPRAISTAYRNDMQREYENLRPHLPEEVHSILDIGCGIGGINVFLFEHYERNRQINFFLLDKSDIAPQLYYGYKSHGAFYNSLDLTRQVLTSHQIPNERIHTLEATSTNDIPISTEVDLVISLISWGFHYPVNTYLERAYALLRPKGRLIIDLRQGTNGVEELRQTFNSVQVIPSTFEICQRVLAIKD